ncbi:C39 family peptidase [Candidatus Woesearchaeota archaeon]|nr:C39 family peptidase [Candidatus Woesearchaeota archaeon]
MLKLKPHIQELKDSCGPACLKIILDYYGIKKSEKSLIKLCKTTKEGTSIENLVKAAKKFSLSVFIKKNASIEDLKKHFHQKIPVIVDWFLEDDGHYAIVAKIDKRNIYLQDPSMGKIRKISLKKFNRIWFDFIHEVPTSNKDFILRRMIVIYKKWGL